MQFHMIRYYESATIRYVVQDFESRLNAEIIKKHLQRIQRAQNQKSSIPGPQEAKECMLAIEKNHMISRRIRLQVSTLTN